MALKSVNLTRAELLTEEQRGRLGISATSGLVIIETRNPDLKIVGVEAASYTEYMQAIGAYREDPEWATNGGKN